MERALTVGRIRIVSFIAGLLALGHASLIHSDRGRHPFCSAQTTQSLVKDKLPAFVYAVESGVLARTADLRGLTPRSLVDW